MVTKPKTKDVEVKEVALEPLQAGQIEDIKHIFRVISFTGAFREDANVHPASVVEDYLKQSYFSQGYVLYKVEHLETRYGRDGDVVGEQMLYVLVKYAQ